MPPSSRVVPAAERFDVVLTADQNIEFQQNLNTLPIAVVVLVADSNRLESLEPSCRCAQSPDSPQTDSLLRVGV